MSPLPDTFDAYRRVVGTTGSEEVWWWYIGQTFAEIEGFPLIPVIQAETIMAYRVETVSPDQFRIDWREIGYFRDAASGEPAQAWTNPITGVRVASPRAFAEGPGSYTLTRAATGVDLAIVQPHARIEGADVSCRMLPNTQIALTQSERKRRGFPQRDGTMPPAGNWAEAHTVLSFYADANDLTQPSAPARGVYSFTLNALAPWMGFDGFAGKTIVRGIIVKATRDEPVNTVARQRLQAAFPSFFV